MFLHIHPKRRDIAVSVRSISYCVTSLVLLLLLLLLPFCLSVCLSFYSSKILLLRNFTHPKWLLMHAVRSYCVTSLVRSSAQKAFSRANNRFYSLRRKDYANVDHSRPQGQRLQILIIEGQILIQRLQWQQIPHHIQILPNGAITRIVALKEMRIKWITFPRNFPRR